MNTPLLAVLRRNIVSYFASPLGYVFICLFVSLSVFAAFWPNDFFNMNLANLDQLNKWFPFIMLVFIPAITMSVWAEERRQGTDELLLTIPAGDLDIVAGKYLAAVAIYTVSLLFSLLCTLLVLRTLGRPDVGLFLGTYLGYWLIGLAMLAIGTVASFLTANLTVAFILGTLFNAPLVFAVMADIVTGRGVAMAIKQWSIGEQFRDFGRGILSLSGLAYFLLIVVAMLYLSMVLIGRRHWVRGKDWYVMAGHYSIRVASLVVLAVALCALARQQLAHAGLATEMVLGLTIALWAGYSFIAILLSRHIRRDEKLALEVRRPTHALLVLRFGGLLTSLVLAGALLFCGLSFAQTFSVLLLWVIPFYWERMRIVGFWGIVARLDTVTGRLLKPAFGVVCAVSIVNVFAQFSGARIDVTSERLSSLSPETVKLIDDLQTYRVVQVEAFISPSVPESYVQTRLNLISILEEFQAMGGDAVAVRINSTERFTEDAARAEKRYGITPRQVATQVRGTFSEDYIFLGVAFTCGLQKVTLPFIDRGTPVEYELVRAIMTVTQQKRKRVGVLQTDAKLYGGFNFQTGSASNNWPIIDELQRSYDVVQVDASSPITEKYDVLLAVQPSSLSPEQMPNFIAAVRSGQPTAIFEDPFPYFAGNVPGTSAPRRMPGMNPMMMMGQQNLPKGDIRQLWSLLGVDFTADDIVYQQYNPLPKLTRLPEEFVFVDRACGAKEPFNDQDPISSHLQHVLFPFPGALSRLNSSSLEFIPLVRTSEKTGIVAFRDMVEMNPFGPGGLNRDRRRIPQGVSYVLAAQIRGKVPASQPMADEGKAKLDALLKGEAKTEPPKTETATINVVVVSDIDVLHEVFFRIREQGEIPESGIFLDFDNVTFVMNVLDDLAGDQRFIEIRKRRPQHRTLETIDRVTEGARKETTETRKKYEDEYQKALDDEQKALDKRTKELEERFKKEEMNTLDAAQRVAIAVKEGQQRLEASKERLKREHDEKVNKIETALELEKRKVQDRYKMAAVVLPPIPPLVVAIVVFFTRRRREREGVARSRLRS